MTRLRWGSIARLLVAHHPRCHPFRHDVAHIGPVALCLGCLTAYPIAAIGLATLWLAHPPTWWAWVLAGTVVGSTQFLSIAGRARTRTRKILIKSALGLGLAMTVYGIIIAPWAPLWRLLALLGGATIASLAMIPRGYRMRATCASCVYQGDWERCTGMQLVQIKPLPPTANA